MLAETARSLAAQTDRRFSVLISDNHSTEGGEFIEAAATRLLAAGLAVQRVRPPVELGRVEHWNWAHHEAGGEWQKPLFAGDWLGPRYVAELHAARVAHPQCRYIFTSFVYHHGDDPPATVRSAWAGRFVPPEKMRQLVLRYGMQFGPPSAAAFERTAFISAGGYTTALPISADSLLFCTLASRHGALGLAEPLCHFNIHPARFSTGLAQKKTLTLQENITYAFMLVSRARAEGSPIPWFGFVRLLAREFRGYIARK